MNAPVVHIDAQAVLGWPDLHFALEAAASAAVRGEGVTAGALLHGMTLEELRQFAMDLMSTGADVDLRKQLSVLALLLLDQEGHPAAMSAETGGYLRRLLALAMAEAHERAAGHELDPDTLLLHDVSGVPTRLA